MSTFCISEALTVLLSSVSSQPTCGGLETSPVSLACLNRTGFDSAIKPGAVHY
jgi:hypothetical protein